MFFLNAKKHCIEHFFLEGDPFKLSIKFIIYNLSSTPRVCVYIYIYESKYFSTKKKKRIMILVTET